MPDSNSPQQQQSAFPSIPGVPDPSRIAADKISQGGAETPTASSNAPPPAIARLYHSLDGGEIIKMLTGQISAMLRRDRRLATNITFPRAMWYIKIDLFVQGREDPHVLFDLAGGHVELDEQSVEYPEDPNKEVKITVSGGQSYVDTPDDIREDHGIDPPVARRHPWGSAETVTDRSQRVADLPPEYIEGRKAIEEMKRSDPMKARRLEEALAGRPHVIVEESPMAKQSRVLSPYDNVDETPSTSAESPHPQESRGSRLREDAVDPRANIPVDPRFHMEGMKPILDAEGRAIKKAQEGSQPSQQSQLDPREQPPARSVSIKDDAGNPRGDILDKAMAQRDRGAPPLNKEVKMQPDSIEAENPDAVSSRQGAPEVIEGLDEQQAAEGVGAIMVPGPSAVEVAEAESAEETMATTTPLVETDVAPDPVEPPSRKRRKSKE